MLRSLTRMKHIIVAVLLTILTVSCSDSDVVADKVQFNVGFYVTVSNNTPHESRGDGRGDEPGVYNPGTGLENYIDIDSKDIRIVLYDLDGKYITTLEDYTITRTVESEYGNSYYINCSTYVDISDGKFKVMFLANWGNYPDLRNINNVFSQEFAFKSASLVASGKDKNLIPFYGIKDVNISGGIKPNIASNLGGIYLIRAFAKIEVNLVSAPSGYTVSKLNLTRYNDRGFCAPTNALKQDDYFQNNYPNEDYVKLGVSIPTDVSAQSDLAFVAEEANKKWVVYVPEYRNTTMSDIPARIEIAFNESYWEGSTFIDFKNKNGALIDINRNYWYKINITKKAEEAEIDVVIDVEPYVLVDLRPSFGIPLDKKPYDTPTADNDQVIEDTENYE